MVQLQHAESKGDGTFAAKVDYPVGHSPQSVVLGDVNSDGKLDILTTGQSSDAVSVLLGTGDRKLAAKVDYTGLAPRWRGWRWAMRMAKAGRTWSLRRTGAR